MAEKNEHLRAAVDALVVLRRERSAVVKAVKEARAHNPEGVDRLVQETRQIDRDIATRLAAAKAWGFDPKILEILVREAMETPAQCRRRLEFELTVATYRSSI